MFNMDLFGDNHDNPGRMLIYREGVNNSSVKPGFFCNLEVPFGRCGDQCPVCAGDLDTGEQLTLNLKQDRDDSKRI